jgi:hypothetical protein
VVLVNVFAEHSSYQNAARREDRAGGCERANIEEAADQRTLGFVEGFHVDVVCPRRRVIVLDFLDLFVLLPKLVCDRLFSGEEVDLRSVVAGNQQFINRFLKRCRVLALPDHCHCSP